MEAQDLSPLCWLSFTASSHDHGYTQKLPATSSPQKKFFLHLFPPPVPWISARLLKGERKPLEMIVLGGLEVQLILCVSTASLYSQQSTAPLGLNPLSVSAELVLTYSSGSDGGVGVVTQTWRCFQSQTSKRKFTEEAPEAEQSLQMPPPCPHGACSKHGAFHRSGTQQQKQGKDNLLGISGRIWVIKGQLVQEKPL